MIDLANESLLSLADAARLLPPARLGRPVSFHCVLRWVLQGAAGAAGNVVKLEALRLGGRWVTSREALQRFAEKLTAPAADDPAPARPRPGGRRGSLIS
jgi:hypothetical protein